MSQTVSPVGLDLEALTSYLDMVGVPRRGPLRAELITGGRSNLTYRVTDGSSRWILRRPPLGRLMHGTHDVGREYRVIAALEGTAVPVPSTVLLVTDLAVIGVPFYLMAEIEGQVLRTADQVSHLSTGKRADLGAALVDTLADLHQLEYEAIGLGDLGRPVGYLARQLERWVRQYHAIAVRDLPQLDLVADALASTTPSSRYASIIHGDYRLDNVMVAAADEARIVGVLDWEMATVGDPLADLATLVMFWDEPDQPFNPITGGQTALPGFPSRGTVIERYLDRMGYAVDDIDWYLAFARFRLAVILEQIHARALSGNTVRASGDGVAGMVPALLDEALTQVRQWSAPRNSRGAR